MTHNISREAAVMLALTQFNGPATKDEIAALSYIYSPVLDRLEAAGGLRHYKEWGTTPSPSPKRLVSAEEYDDAPAGTIVEFDRHPGTLGYLNWDHRWELSADPRPHDHAAATVAEHEGPSTVVRWGQDSTRKATP